MLQHSLQLHGFVHNFMKVHLNLRTTIISYLIIWKDQECRRPASRGCGVRLCHCAVALFKGKVAKQCTRQRNLSNAKWHWTGSYSCFYIFFFIEMLKFDEIYNSGLEALLQSSLHPMAFSKFTTLRTLVYAYVTHVTLHPRLPLFLVYTYVHWKDLGAWGWG